MVSLWGFGKDSQVALLFGLVMRLRGRICLLSAGVLRLLALVFALVATWIFIRSYVSLTMKTIRLPRWLGEWGSLLGTGTMDQDGAKDIPPAICG